MSEKKLETSVKLVQILVATLSALQIVKTNQPGFRTEITVLTDVMMMKYLIIQEVVTCVGGGGGGGGGGGMRI